MSDLSDEIMVEILARLPAKSLVRFNLVCKQWCSLISHPHFVRKHLRHVLLDQSNNHNKLIIHPTPLFPPSFISCRPFTVNFYSIDYFYEESLNSSTSTTKRQFPLQTPRGLRILGSCNGLLLVGYYNSKYGYDALVLWNPSLREYNTLPECSSISGFKIRMLGFGYDSALDDYKVVRVTTNSTYDEPMRIVEQRVEIYSLKANSWKTIQGGIPYGNVCIEQLRGTLVSGSIYWVVTDADYEEEQEFNNLILAFDLIDEKFRLVGVPRHDDREPVSGSLVEVRGCLGLYQTQPESRDVEIWMLKKNENKNEYWTKLMIIPKDCGMYSRPAFFMKNNEVLMSTAMCKEDKILLVVYNPVNMTFCNLPCGITDWWEEIIYVETLVSPHGIGG
ncbi:hypothetical protein LguiB_025716 [Lonicera macranthoides]